MNKNTRANKARAAKNFAKGIKETNCTRMITVPGGLKEFSFTLTVGTRPRKHRHAKVAWCGGKADRGNRAPNATAATEAPVESATA
jgi:hypothetical protein